MRKYPSHVYVVPVVIGLAVSLAFVCFGLASVKENATKEQLVYIFIVAGVLYVLVFGSVLFCLKAWIQKKTR